MFSGPEAGGSVGDPAVDRESAPGDCPQGMASGEDRGVVNSGTAKRMSDFSRRALYHKMLTEINSELEIPDDHFDLEGTNSLHNSSQDMN